MNWLKRLKPRPVELLALLSGLLLILAYWYSIHPMDFARGYTEDWCQSDMGRQVMSEAISKTGGPSFQSSAYMAPFGMRLPFISWGMEVSWLGAYFWKWAREFPYTWALFGVSLLGSYLGVGLILRKMRLGPVAAWGLALTVVGFHIARHFKIWHHYEHVLQHWVYWSLFLDAWIWQRFCRERKWSWSLDAWRGLCLVGMLTTAGYFWGPLILEWALVRVCMAALWAVRRVRGSAPLVIEGRWRQALPAVALGLIFVGLDLRWFLPLSREAQALGAIPQDLGWFGHWPYLFRPLWLDDLAAWLSDWTGRNWVRSRFNTPETIITPGLFLWIPVLAGLFRVERVRRHGSGLLVALPFVALFTIAVFYFDQDPPVVAPIIQKFVPFMEFFRVTVRWGLLMPQMLGVIIALCWPELRAWVRGAFVSRPRQAWACLAVFAVSSGFEISQLRAPVSTMPQLSESATHLLEGVRNSPGTTVLDLPFCLAGGNGICSAEQCPNYPESTTGACLRGWHDKNVYGIYSGRLVPSQCLNYHRAPYLSWFDAWRTQRCFSAPEWVDFCSYLNEHSELSAILVYPDIWQGAGRPECMAEFARHLGQPIDQAQFVVHAVRGSQAAEWARLWRFAAHCK